MIQKLLIANRGEIAVRVIRAARQLGIKTVAVYSEADAGAMHVRLADEAREIGESEPRHSYLNADHILQAARDAGCDAIHPGYGFLSERASFSRQCREAGIVFVGPPPEAMERLGAKIDSKQLAVQNQVPIAPGFFEVGASVEAMEAAAREMGYPVMLKASAGGGGRGMRAVRDPADFQSELKLASEEALNAFGDGAMMVEKLIDRPRHIEVQVLADAHGNAVALFERECSLQRRHQKLIEEAASPYVMRHPGLWDSMRDAALRLVKAAGYVGAGTVEFMVDSVTGAFYFLEVNARLQVEHPVTEEAAGVDLVAWQLRVASGETLDLSPTLMAGSREALRGHSIEARIVAEDPERGFLPSVGRVVGWAEPRGPGIRVETGFGQGAEVTRYYDSLIAKVIATGETRAAAIQRLRGALLDFHILGVKTNIPYLLDVIAHPGFMAGEIDTGFLGREMGDWKPSGGMPSELPAIAESAGVAGEAGGREAAYSLWASAGDFRVVKDGA